MATSGEARLSGFRAFVDDLVTDARFRPGMAILVDHSQIDPRGISTSEIRTLAEVVADMGDRIGGSIVACVAPRDAMYGLARAFEMAAEEAPIAARVFRTHEEARTWIAERKAAQPPRAG